MTTTSPALSDWREPNRKPRSAPLLRFVRKSLVLLALTPLLAPAFGGRANAQSVPWAWGYNTDGELGPNPTGGEGPTQVPVVATTVAAGQTHSLALDKNGNVWAWGYNSRGELGHAPGADGDINGDYNPQPTQVSGLTGIVQISAGSNFSLALDKNGVAWAWGYNYHGELGSPSNNNANPTPTQIAGLPKIASISASEYSCTVALDVNGGVWAWGDNRYGQLGVSANTGTDNANPTPAKIAGLPVVTKIAAGDVFVLAISSAGAVYAWGDNRYGQLSGLTNNGNDTANYAPAQVGTLTGVIAIAAGNSHSLAFDKYGTAWAWGRNGYGELGHPKDPSGFNPVPTVVQGLNNVKVVALAAGSEFSLALDASGNVWAWGYDEYNELGNGANYNGSAVPTEIPGLTNVTSISAESDFSLAIAPHENGFFWRDAATNQFVYSGLKYQNGAPTVVTGDYLSPVTQSWQLVGLVNYIHDGNPELLWYNSATDQVAVWFMSYAFATGTASLNTNDPYYYSGGVITTPGAGTSWHLVGAADFNKDGIPDLLWWNPSTGDVVWWEMNYSNGALSVVEGSYIVYGSGPSPWTPVSIVDFNQDGYPDILWRNTSTGDVTWSELQLANSGLVTTVGGGYIVKGAPLSWRLVGAADINGDGYPDLLWENGGQIPWWQLSYSNGAVSVVGGGYITTNASLMSSYTLSTGF